MLLLTVSPPALLCWQDYLRPSVESILQSSLISTYVAREQRKAQSRLQRGSCDLEQPKLVELKLKEQALRQREQDLKEREQRLERKDNFSSLMMMMILHCNYTFLVHVFPSPCREGAGTVHQRETSERKAGQVSQFKQCLVCQRWRLGKNDAQFFYTTVLLLCLYIN